MLPSSATFARAQETSASRKCDRDVTQKICRRSSHKSNLLFRSLLGREPNEKRRAVSLAKARKYRWKGRGKLR